MRLPGITQGAVQGLGRDTTDAYAGQRNAVDAANIAMQKASNGVTIAGQRGQLAQKATGLVTEQIRKREAANEAMMAASQKAEAMKALTAYKANVSATMKSTTDFDENGSPIWDNEADKLHSIKREAQKTAREGIVSDQAGMMFEEGKLEIDALADGAWANKVNTAQLVDAENTAIETLDGAVLNHDWDNADIVLNDPHFQMVMTPKAQRAYKAKVQRGRKLDGYEQSRLAKANSPEKSLGLKQKAREDNNLSTADQRSFIAAVNTGQINYETQEMTTGLNQIEQEKGLTAAVAVADATINDYIRRSAEELGGDEVYKSTLVDKMQAVRNDYARGLKVISDSSKRNLISQLIFSGRLKVSPRKNAKEYNSTAQELVGGQWDDKGKYIEGSIDEAALIDPESEQNAIMVALTKRFGFFPMHFERTMGTVLLNGTDQEKADVIEVFAMVADKDPAYLFNNPEASYVKDLYSLVQLTGQTKEGKEEALKLYNAKAALGEAEQKMYKDQRYSHDYKEVLDKSFNRTLEEKFPVVNKFFGTSPAYVQNGMRNRIKSLAGEYLPLAQGDTQRSLDLAIESLKHEYGVSTIGSKAELVHRPAGKIMSNTTGLPPKQNDIWIKQQLSTEIKAAQVLGGGDPNYDTNFIEMVAGPDFDVKNPVYTLIDNNPRFGGMSIPLNTYQPVFEGTPMEREQRRVAEIAAARADAKNKQTQDSLQWQKDNPSLLVVKDPALKYALDPHEGAIPRMQVGLKNKAEDLRYKMFGPLTKDSTDTYPSEDNL